MSANFLQELQRRKVVRVAGVYAVVAWLLIQVADNLVPALQLPDWTNSFIVLLLLIGFPIALVLAWAYEVTPEGIKPDFAAQSAPTTTNNTDRKLIYATFALVLVVAVFQIGERFTGDIPNSASAISNATSARPQPLRAAVSLGNLQRYTTGVRSNLALSPDGRWLAYTTRVNEMTNLQLRDLVTGESRTLVESVRIRAGSLITRPAFSPSGEQILYYYAEGMHIVPRAGGRPRTLAVTTGHYSVGGISISAPNWLSEDSIVFTNSDGVLERLSISTGEIVPLDIPRIEGEANNRPRLMGDGPWLLYSVLTAEWFGSARLDAFNMDTGEVRNLIANGYNGHYLDSGHLVYMRDNGLWAASIDGQQMQINGAETLIEDRIETSPASGSTSYALSETGRLVYVEGDNTSALFPELWMLSSVTGERQTLNLPANAHHPVFSPDGEQVAVTVQDTDIAGVSLGTSINGVSNIVGYIALYHLADGSLTRRSFTGAAFRPIWTPDGKQLVYGMFMDNAWGLWMRTADGSGQPRQLLSAAEPVWPESITADGASLVYGIGDAPPGSSIRLQLLSLLETAATGQPLIDFGTLHVGALISPDGRFIAYSGNEPSNAPGRDIIVRPFPNVNDGQWQITSGRSASHAIWERSGKSMYFWDFNGDIYRVPADPENNFRQGSPELVINTVLLQSFRIQTPGFAVSPDGQRILHRELATGITEVAAEPTYAVLVDNWTEKLRQMVPPSN